MKLSPLLVAALILSPSIALTTVQSSRLSAQEDSGATAASLVKIDPRTDVVYIDWSMVESTSRGNGPAAAMPVLVAVSKVMLSIRRGTWKPMPK